MNLLLQVLSLQFVVTLNASGLDHHSSQETGGGIKQLRSHAVWDNFEEIGNLKVLSCAVHIFIFIRDPLTNCYDFHSHLGLHTPLPCDLVMCVAALTFSPYP